MKKKFVLLIVVFVVLASVSLTSANAASVQKNKTSGRNVIEYIELAMNRLTIYAEEIKYDSRECLNPFTGLITDYANEYSIYSSVGHLTVSKEDNTINSAIIMTVNVDSRSISLKNELYKCIASISALEFDKQADSAFSLKYAAGLSPSKDSIEEASRIWTEEMYPKFKETLKSTTRKNVPMLIYSGNYDYYIEYSDISGSLVMTITAQKR